jgi:diketogulonate reductase-like aldo/keto reductase
MAATSPSIALNNGVELPLLGLGVFQSPPDQTLAAVEAALRGGYRLIDTAAAYLNEAQVGEAIRRSGVARADVFVTTKLWISDYGHDRALHGFERSLRKLGLEYVDLYLLHQPVPTDFAGAVAAYRALEELLADQRVRAIGVSNFSAQHLDDLMRAATVVPAVNQVEVHPFFSQPQLRAEHARRGIVTQAWSPIGGVTQYMPGSTSANPLEHPTIRELAERHRKTPAQVILRWHLERGVAAIPKSVRAERIAENLDVFDFALTPDEVASIDALDRGARSGPDPETLSLKTFNLRIED